jgi:hypothetical protein
MTGGLVFHSEHGDKRTQVAGDRSISSADDFPSLFLAVEIAAQQVL